MDKMKLTDSRLFLISKEFAIILNDYCLEDEGYKNWGLKEFRIFVDKHYDDLVLTAIDEGIIMPSEKKHFKNYVGNHHEAIKTKTIEILKDIIEHNANEK